MLVMRSIQTRGGCDMIEHRAQDNRGADSLKITLSEAYRDHVRDRFTGNEVAYYSQQVTDAEEFVRQIAASEVIGVRWPIRAFRISRDVIEQLPCLQFIHATGTGTDWYDVEALTENGILLANNHGFNAANVAEHAASLILMALRNTHWYAQAVRDGKWRNEAPPNGISSLRGKTVGIVGLGKSGAFLASAMLGLGARVIAVQRRQSAALEILSDIEWRSFHELLQESDVVSLHVPLTPETDGMIGESELALMKPTAVLVNCSRGRVIDEQALYETMRDGHLRAAALDVFQQEPLPVDHPLLGLENVIATPHVGGQSIENVDDQIEGTLGNIERFIAGQVPHRIANPAVLDEPHLRAGHLRASE